MKELRKYVPDGGECEEKFALCIIEAFFNLMALYLKRTTSDSPRRTISVQQLRTELKVYAWSGFVEWIDENASDCEYDEVMEKMGHLALVMERSDFGLPGVVSRFWLECLYDVVGTSVWRDESVKRSEMERKVACGAVVAAGVWGLMAGVAWACGCW